MFYAVSGRCYKNKKKMFVQHMNKRLNSRLLCSTLSSAACFRKAAEAVHARSAL